MPSHSQEHNELAEMNEETFAPKRTHSPHEEYNTSSSDETQKIEEDGQKKRNDSADSQEDGKTINLQASSVVAVDHCIGSNTLDGQPSLEPDDCFSAEPVTDPIWRGWFNIKEESETSVEILAHLSNKACSKVSETASAIPPMLEIQVLDKWAVWPKSFTVSPPTAACIALYFFPACERDERVFGILLDEVIARDLALKTVIANVELLIFSSRELPIQNWRQKSKYFLWGVFRQKKCSHSSAETASPNQQHSITEHFPLSEPTVEANNKVLVHPESAHIAGSIGSMRLGPSSATPCTSQAEGSFAPSPSPSSVAPPPGLHKFIARATEPPRPGHGCGRGPEVPPPAAHASHAVEASRRPLPPPQSAPASQSQPVDPARGGPSTAMRSTLNVGPSTAPPSVAASPTPSSVAPPPPSVVRKYISLSDARSDRDFHSAIGAVVRSHFPQPWPTYRDIPANHQDFWFQQLKLRYYWDCTDDEMFKVFKMFAGKYMRRNFSAARKSLTRPLWLANEIWRQLQEYWASPKFQKEAAKNKTNQAANSTSATTVYRGGSSSVGMHKRKLESQLGRPPKQMELFSKCYKKKANGNWSGPRAEHVAEIFQKLMEDQQLQAPVDGHDPTSLASSVAQREQQLWITAVGGPNKGRVFGLGSEVHMSRASQRAAPPPPPPPPNLGTVGLKQRLERMEGMMMQMRHMMTQLNIPPMPEPPQPLSNDQATADEPGDDEK
ncbi:UNVERIFIED_CONTAM: hypothetical protein Sradi_3225200 [Sesamum radiatum]|uniref:AIPP2-like SPOC-like domain-containing protein n=1 Tax=Sesamum radiatum TaxID=300843 RepID=A0AAW2RG43_SESRA